jgi:hypothetical protein
MRDRSAIRLLIALLALIWIPACAEDEDGDEMTREPIVLLERAGVVGSHLVLVDTENDRAFMLDLGAKKKLADNLVEKTLAPNPFWIEPREGKAKEALILSAGRRGVAQSTVLTALRVNGKIREYPLNAPFDTIAQTERGRYAMLYFGGGADELLYSPNEVAVVDLEAEPDENNAVVRRSVETPGGPPTAVEVSPKFVIGDLRREVAVLLSESHVTLVDMVNSNRGETLVRLSSGDGDDAVRPEQVRFDESRQEIYVRAANSNDIYVLRLEPSSKDFKTTVSQIPVGDAPSDMDLFGPEGSRRLLVLSRGEAHVVTVSDSTSDEGSDDDESETAAPPRVVDVELETEAERLLLYETEVSGEDGKETRHHALLYRPGGRVLTFLDLAEIDLYREQNLSFVEVREPIVRVEPLLDHNLALVIHDSSRLDVVNLEKRRVTSLTVNGPVQNAIYGAERPRLWIAPPGQHFVGYVDLQTGSTDEVLLNDPLSQLVLVPDEDLVVAIHEFDESEEDDDRRNTIGITLVDALEPARDTAVFFDGFVE